MLTEREQKYYRSMIIKSKRILSDLDIPYAAHISFDTMNRKRTWGLCKPASASPRYRRFTITVNETLIKNGDDTAIMDTIIHELLHTVPKGLSHTGNWLKYAKKVNRYHPEFNIKRCTSYEEKGIERPAPKFVIECPDCKHKYLYYRNTSTVKKIAKGVLGIRCGVCNCELPSTSLVISHG